MNHFIKKLEKLKKKRRRMSLARMSQKKVIFFLQIRRDKLKLVHTMLHKVTYNYSALLLEEHLKCSVERSVPQFSKHFNTDMQKFNEL